MSQYLSAMWKELSTAFLHCVRKKVACSLKVTFPRSSRAGKLPSRVLFRFKDGSVIDETESFSQGRTFQLITNHHIQKGPSFPHPVDLSIDARSGQVTVRSTVKAMVRRRSQLNTLICHRTWLPVWILSITKNIRPDTPETKVSMIVVTPSRGW